MSASQIDFLAVSAHKVYAPFGSGALLARRAWVETCLPAIQPVRLSGEENIAGIAAFGKALQLLGRVGLPLIAAQEQMLCRSLIAGLKQVPGIELYGLTRPDDPLFQRRIGVVSFRLRHVPHNLLAEKCSEIGAVGLRQGCFCSHLLVKRLMSIHPLRGILADLGSFLLPAFTARVAPGLVRVSLGLENTPEDISRLVDTLQAITRLPVPWYEKVLASIYNGTPFLPDPNRLPDLAAFIAHLQETVWSNLPAEAGPDGLQDG